MTMMMPGMKFQRRVSAAGTDADSPGVVAPTPPKDEEQDEEDLVQNKLELARAYLELGDEDNVRSILNEVLSEGNTEQREDARQLLEQI